MSTPVKAAIIGCGYVFDHYMSTVAAHTSVEIAALWDIDAARLAKVADYYKLPAATSYEAILSDPSIRLIVNLTSIDAHEAVIRQALEAGKHVYSEKPLTTDIGQARALFDLAKSRGLMLTAAPCNQFSDSVQTMWRAVRSGAIGRPLIAYAEFDDNPIYLMHPDGWQSRSGAPWPYLHEYEAGCTWEHVGYHLVWLCTVFGPAKSVTAFSKVTVPHKTDKPIHPADTPDFSVATVDFVSGPVARITCSIAGPQDHRMRIIGDQGEISTDTYRHYQSPVRLERFTTLSLNARKALTVRRHPSVASPFGVGGKKVRLLEFPWSHATRRPSQRGRLAPHKALIAWMKRREIGAQDKMLGVALTARAIAENGPPPVSPEFVLHVNELTLAIQAAGTSGAPHVMSSGFEPMQPLSGELKPLPDWRKTHKPGFLDRISERLINRLHRH